MCLCKCHDIGVNLVALKFGQGDQPKRIARFLHSRGYSEETIESLIGDLSAD